VISSLIVTLTLLDDSTSNETELKVATPLITPAGSSQEMIENSVLVRIRSNLALFSIEMVGVTSIVTLC